MIIPDKVNSHNILSHKYSTHLWTASRYLSKKFMQLTADNYIMYTLIIVNERLIFFLLAGFAVLIPVQLYTTNMQRKVNTAKSLNWYLIAEHKL